MGSSNPMIFEGSLERRHWAGNPPKAASQEKGRKAGKIRLPSEAIRPPGPLVSPKVRLDALPSTQ